MSSFSKCRPMLLERQSRRRCLLDTTNAAHWCHLARWIFSLAIDTGSGKLLLSICATPLPGWKNMEPGRAPGGGMPIRSAISADSASANARHKTSGLKMANWSLPISVCSACVVGGSAPGEPSRTSCLDLPF